MQATVAPSGPTKYVPILGWLPRHQPGWPRADLLAGLVAAAVVIRIYYANRSPVYAVGRRPGTDVFRRLADHPDDETFPGLPMLRSGGWSATPWL